MNKSRVLKSFLGAATATLCLLTFQNCGQSFESATDSELSRLSVLDGIQTSSVGDWARAENGENFHLTKFSDIVRPYGDFDCAIKMYREAFYNAGVSRTYRFFVNGELTRTETKDVAFNGDGSDDVYSCQGNFRLTPTRGNTYRLGFQASIEGVDGNVIEVDFTMPGGPANLSSFQMYKQYVKSDGSGLALKKMKINGVDAICEVPEGKESGVSRNSEVYDQMDLRANRAGDQRQVCPGYSNAGGPVDLSSFRMYKQYVKSDGSGLALKKMKINGVDAICEVPEGNEAGVSRNSEVYNQMDLRANRVGGQRQVCPGY